MTVAMLMRVRRRVLWLLWRAAPRPNPGVLCRGNVWFVAFHLFSSRLFVSWGNARVAGDGTQNTLVNWKRRCGLMK